MSSFRIRPWSDLVNASLSLPPANYVVGEATQIIPTHPFGHEYSSGCPEFSQLTSWNNLRYEDTLLSPVSWSTQLLPTRTNSVGVSFEYPETVVLTIECNGEAELLNSRLSESGPPPELDLYADPLPRKSGPDSVSSQMILEAFAALTAGEYHPALAYCSDELFPRRGVRPAVCNTWASRAGAHPENLLADLMHPFRERFIRLPLRPLLSPSFIEGNRIVLRVKVGEMAEEVAHRLVGRLFVNHVLFWNRLLAQRDPLRSVTDTIRGRNAIVLQIEDIRTGYCCIDHRFGPYEDPSRLFRLVPAENEDVSAIEYLGTPIPPQFSRVQYLLPVDWRDFQVEPGTTGFVQDSAVAFVARTPIAPLPQFDAEPGATARRAAALTLHPQTLHGELPMTARELRDLIGKWLPPQIAQYVDRRNEAWICFESQIRVPNAVGVRIPHQRPARNVTVCWLRLRPNAPVEKLQHQRRWLSRILTRKHFAVEVDFDQEDQS